MPSYTVQSPAGQAVTIEGDSPPTEKELDDIFAKVAPADTPAPVASGEDPDPMHPIMGASGGLLAGQRMGKGVPVPSVLKDTALEAGGPALGQTIGAFGGPLAPVTVPLGGAIGGVAGDYAAQRRRISAGEQDKLKFGELAASGFAGMIPGGSLAKATTGAVVRQGLKGAAVNLASKAIETGIDEQRLPTASEAMLATVSGGVGGAVQAKFGPVGELSAEDQLYSARNAALKALRGEGVKVPPHELGKGSDMISSVSGKAALQQAAAKDNQFAWNRLAREEFGQSGALPVLPEQYAQIRKDSYEPYEKLKSISEKASLDLEDLKKRSLTASGAHALAVQESDPAFRALMDPLVTQAAGDVDALKVARFKAQSAYDSFKAGNPAAYDAWQSARAQAETLNDRLIDAAKSVGDPDLVKRLDASRTTIAKSYAAESATDKTTGLVDPVRLAAQFNDGVPLTGNLKKMADFANAFKREAVMATSVPSPGVNNLNMQLVGNSMAQGSATGVAAGILQGTLGKVTRPAQLSAWNQSRLLNPNLITRPSAKQFAATLARYGAMSAGR